MALAIIPTPSKAEIGVVGCIQLDQAKCDEIKFLSLDKSNLKVKGKINQDSGALVDNQKRDVDVWIINEAFEWVDKLIINAAISANESFNYDIVGLCERPQLLRYSAPSIGYDWHLDVGTDRASNRKISISIGLSENYEGGELAFFTEKESRIKLQLGQGVAFPSWMTHRVLPVQEGDRWALVAWITGPSFR